MARTSLLLRFQAAFEPRPRLRYGWIARLPEGRKYKLPGL